MAKVFHSLPPIVEVARSNVSVGPRHVVASRQVGPAKSGIDGPELIADTHAIYDAGFGISGPRRIAVICPLQISNDPAYQVRIFQCLEFGEIPTSCQALDHLIEGPVGQEIAIEPFDTHRSIENSLGCSDLSNQVCGVAQGAVLEREDLFRNLSSDESDQGSDPFDRLARLVHRSPKCSLTIKVSSGRRLQLLHGDPLYSDPEWLGLAELEIDIEGGEVLLARVIGGQSGHKTSVMSGSMRSAGLLPYRLNGGLEVLIAHPGGPWFANKDRGAWSVVKGLVKEGETDVEAAKREFEEETGWDPPRDSWVSLGETVLKSRKVVVAWGIEKDFDLATFDPGTFTMHGREYPEVDRVEWMAPQLARTKLNEAQSIFISRLEAHLGLNGPQGGLDE